MQANFIVKIDDDVFVNVVLLIDEMINKYQNISRKIMGLVKWKDTAPIFRGPMKWKVDKNDFVNLTHYPFPHCKGFFVVISHDIIKELFEAAKVTPFFWIDDIYLFGQLPEKIKNVTYKPLDRLNLSEKKAVTCFGATDKRCSLLAAGAYSDGVMAKLWYGALRQNEQLASKYLNIKLRSNQTAETS